MTSFASLGRFNIAAGFDEEVINASTATVEKFAVAVWGTPRFATIANWTSTGDMDLSQFGSTPLQVEPSSVADHTTVAGVAQVQIPPGGIGLVRRYGFTFIRVKNGIANMGSKCGTSAVAGCVAASTGASFFFAHLTATLTWTPVNAAAFSFTVSHAYGFVNCLNDLGRF